MQSIRQEQDSEYEKSLKADREKVPYPQLSLSLSFLSRHHNRQSLSSDA